MSEAQLKQYAELAVGAGVNLQQDQLLIIHSDIQNATFARLVQTAAYQAGASKVCIDWTDEQSTKAFLSYAAEHVIEHYPDWQVARYKEWEDAGAAYIHIISENLEVFKDIPTEKITRFMNASRSKLKDHHAKIRSHEVRWCLITVPSVEWATKVFPGLSEEEAIQSLWRLILKGSRADGANPIQDSESHNRTFESRKNSLNEYQFESLHFTNSRGTDLVVGLPHHHRFIGGGVFDQYGIPFFPNIPTEEIFTAPHKHKVNGKLVGTKPLIYEGRIIDEFYLIFKEGRITDYSAAKGQELLQHLIETDEGSHYLGEIALVSNQSPLAQTDTLFYNTLFDENTSCHIGIGHASPSTIRNGIDQSEEELRVAGLNTSILAVNVTFGTEDMKIQGVMGSGAEVLLMKDGEFQF
ncbi:peptidase M29 [Pontibacillus halophilus JSM 076056 = DSM 19796]|uniref:Peptidase M29 n=1 Tax=Pontibacillus halophilus JSM 076056 = DSM 19796 TaxID=1385510 RepID=A0A0A5I973_9BACI|nr:peptidase M29 [Pontibacillus halophilus JSM 076056 = DSM 19796]